MGVIGRQSDRQHLADRLDPMRLAVIVDEGNHGLNRRSSSAWAKYALALRRISLACRSSRFSRSRASALSPHPWEHRRAHHCRARPSSPTHAASAPCSRSWRRSMRPRPSARHARLRDPKPFAPRGRGPRKRTCWSSCLSWLHLLRSWSLRSTRSGSRWLVEGLGSAALHIATTINEDEKRERDKVAAYRDSFASIRTPMPTANTLTVGR